MIGKIIIGKSFRGCINYVLQNKLRGDLELPTQKRAELIHFNHCFGDRKELIQQFNEVRLLNPKLTNPVMHLILSLSPGENPEKATLIAMAEDCSQALGFDKNQYIAVTHNDTHHLHLHIVVNRIDFDGKTLSDSNNYKKIAAFCRQMEEKYQLQTVLSPRAFLPKSSRTVPRLDSRKEMMKSAIRISLLQAKSYPDFESLMRAKGYEIIKGRGVAFRDSKKMYAKGSELGYSLATIEKILGLSHNQKQILIRQHIQKENSLRKGRTPRSLSTQKNTIQDPSFGSTNTFEILLRPETDFNHSPQLFLKKKRKKKRSLSQHL
jgi:hypothetical protein